MGSAEGNHAKQLLRVERRGTTLTLTLDSPHNRNALSSGLLAALAQALAEAAVEASVRCVVLTATGKVFCAGADLRERLHGPSSEGPTVGGSLPGVLTAIASMPKPVVARVNGHARAGGLGLIAACDLAAAPTWATFALSEVRVGVAPAVIAVPLLRVMGRRAFLRHALTAEPFSAAEAVDSGLLTAAVDDLDRWTAEQVAALAGGGPRALAATKALPAHLEDTTWDEGLRHTASLTDRLFAGPEAAEGMAAFLEKRSPSWAEREAQG